MTTSPIHTSVINQNTAEMVEHYNFNEQTVITLIGFGVLFSFIFASWCGVGIYCRLKKKKKAPSKSPSPLEMNIINSENTLPADSSHEAGQTGQSPSSGDPDCLIEGKVEVVVHADGAVQSVVHSSSGMV